ncbi:MAG: hypothetical protein UD759_01715 [Clostridia bacterium]|nr:hypothetical protein [Clostridia bacterium]
MNKREYFSAVNEIVKKAIAARIEAQTALDDVEEKISNRRKYSVEHINKVLEPQRRDLRRQINDAADRAKIEVEKLTTSYVAELEAENLLDGSAMTDDARLLSVGVKLRDTDLEKMFDKHAGNYTMQRLIADYADQNGIRIRRAVEYPNGYLIQTVKNVPYVANKSVGWHTRPEFYEQFMGENSELAQIMNG